MKRIRILLPVLLLMAFVYSTANLYAQKEKTKKKATGKAGVVGVTTVKSDKKDSNLQYFIDKKDVKEYDDYLYLKGAVKNYEDAKGLFRSGGWTDNYTDLTDGPVISSGTNLGFTYGGFAGNSNSLVIQKLLRGDDSFNRKSSFEVENDQKSFSLNMEADCSEGKIVFSIFSPSQRLFKELVVNEGETRSWSKNIPLASLDENDREKNIGKWVLKVEVKDAKGRYKISAKSR